MKKMRSTQGRNAVEGPLERVLGASAGDSRDNQSYPEQRGRIPGRGEGREETLKWERDRKQEEGWRSWNGW